jgi:hypothetical protein|tara:strand:- start:10831 stop:11355 length:525 start_codon:yes stop_codon:yes gene_type:complete
MMHQEVTNDIQQSIHDALNLFTQEFFHYEPSIMIFIQAVWRDFEESIHTWFYQNKSQHQPPVTRELVELEETQNARKLDAFKDKDKEIDIDERFLCGITHEVMTHPMYDKNNPHQKMDCRALLKWLGESETHPFNRSELHRSDLEYDEKLKVEIDQFVTDTIDASEAPRRQHRC